MPPGMKCQHFRFTARRSRPIIHLPRMFFLSIPRRIGVMLLLIGAMTTLLAQRPALTLFDEIADPKERAAFKEVWNAAEP